MVVAMDSDFGGCPLWTSDLLNVHIDNGLAIQTGAPDSVSYFSQASKCSFVRRLY
jgi:hypothetical protein